MHDILHWSRPSLPSGHFGPSGGAIGRQRFKIFQHLPVLMRLRQGEPERELAPAELMERPKATAVCAMARARGWLDPAVALPDDAEIAAAVVQARTALDAANWPGVAVSCHAGAAPDVEAVSGDQHAIRGDASA